jgi:hypothetical protein
MSPMPWFNRAGAGMTDTNGCFTFKATGEVWVETVLADGRWGHLNLGEATNCAFVVTNVDLSYGSTDLHDRTNEGGQPRGGVTTTEYSYAGNLIEWCLIRNPHIPSDGADRLKQLKMTPWQRASLLKQLRDQ